MFYWFGLIFVSTMLFWKLAGLTFLMAFGVSTALALFLG